MIPFLLRLLWYFARFIRQQPWPSVPELIFDDIHMLHSDSCLGLLLPVLFCLSLRYLWLLYFHIIALLHYV